MKSFHVFDFYFQVVLIGTGIVWSLVAAGEMTFIVHYFTVGGWQLLSTTINRQADGKVTVRERHYYNLALLALPVIMIIMLVLGIGIYGLLGLLFVAPVMAFYYLYVSYKQMQLTKQMRHRHFLDVI